MEQADHAPCLPDSRRRWLLFLAATVFLGITSGMYETSFNNYLSDVFQVSSTTRGLLEFPRELPGCGVVVITAVLAFLPETRIAVLAVAGWAVGLFGLGLMSHSLPVLVGWMMALSTAMHLYLPLNQSIGVSVAGGDHVASRLGQLGGANTAAIIVGAGVVWLGTRFWNLGYAGVFAVAATTTLLAAACLAGIRTPPRPRTAMKARIVVKRRYSSFYALNVLFGARKQVFITFAPWTIVKVFHQPASTIAMLWIVSSVLGIAFRPLLGTIVDSWGERKVLMGEALILVLVCLGYASTGWFGPAGSGIALWLAYVCFVADQLLMAVGIARTTYLHKIVEVREDFTPTLALGISLDHVVSMVVPALGGLLWTAAGYSSVFLAAALVALANLAVAGQVRVPEPSGVAVACGHAAASGPGPSA